MSRELLQQVLPALTAIGNQVCGVAHHKKSDRHEMFSDCPIQTRHDNVIKAVRTALASPEQPASPAAIVPDEREAFEAYCVENGLDVRRIGDSIYMQPVTRKSWDTWQARAALAAALASPEPVTQSLTREELKGRIKAETAMIDTGELL